MVNQESALTKNQVDFSRLPADVIPTHYFLNLRPDLNNFTISGTETVNVEVLTKTDTVVLNSLDIEIQSASFVSKDQEQQSAQIEIRKDDEVVIIKFPNELAVGSGQLKLQFTSIINDTLNGCYRTKYTTPEGEERYGLTTQFESVYCRRAFPCWDEPERKAKFDLTLVAPKDRVALSNMNILEETEDEADKTKRVLKFATTPVMSTYLLCYIIGDYDFIESQSKNCVKVRVYTQLGKTEQGTFALDVAVRCLDFYEDYFKVPYPLPKLDLIAIADFESGAMENWGLVTYRETCILVDPQNTSTASKEYVALVVCHELAHQWFGNLCTMGWWDNLWLNEGFATFMQFFSVDRLFPEYNIWQSFVAQDLTSALHLDAMHNSHPIEMPVKYASEIDEIFDEISYEKGASVVRMLFAYLGNDDFQKGMNIYLKRFSYKNTVTEDLWTALEEASNKPVKAIMNTWVQQKGFPLVTVLSSRQDGSNRILTLSQEKFSIDGKTTESEQQIKWLIPIAIITQNNPKPTKVLLENRTQEVVLENVEPTEWIKLNSDMGSFIHVNYPSELLDQFQSSIVNKTLSSIDRFNLLEDSFALVKCGKISSDRILKLMKLYQSEDQYPVWNCIITCLGEFNQLLDYTDFQEVFHIYARNLLAKIYEKVGNKPVQGEDHQVALLRSIVLRSLVSCKDPQFLKEAKSQFESHVAKITHIPADLRASIYRAITSDCDDKTFEYFFQLYREADLNEEKNRIAISMAATRDPARIQKLIDFALSEIRNQDSPFVLTSIAKSNKVGRDIVWNYFRENYAVFIQKFKAGPLLRIIAGGLIADFASIERMQEVDAFFAANPIPSAERKIKQSLESIKLKADLLSRESPIIKNYLTSSGQL